MLVFYTFLNCHHDVLRKRRLETVCLQLPSCMKRVVTNNMQMVSSENNFLIEKGENVKLNIQMKYL